MNRSSSSLEHRVLSARLDQARRIILACSGEKRFRRDCLLFGIHLLNGYTNKIKCFKGRGYILAKIRLSRLISTFILNPINFFYLIIIFDNFYISLS